MITAHRPAALDLFPHAWPTEGPDLLWDPSFPHREELLQFIWEQRLFNDHDLRTTDGARVEVLDPGSRHAGSGPDLHGAHLVIGGQRWAGTVEVHVRAGEWYDHGHEQDPAYDTVLLHVVWAHDRDVRTISGRCPPTVVLRDRVAPERLALCERLLRSLGWVPCAGGLAGVPGTVVERCLDELLFERLERKAAAVAHLHASLGHDPWSTAHHMLLRGFGGPVNAEACGMLAHSLPVRTLLKARHDLFRLEALLFGQSGLIPSSTHEPYPASLLKEHALLARLHGSSPMPVVAWRTGGVRPGSFPTLRLAQFARFFHAHGDTIVDLLLHAGPEELQRVLVAEADGYWRTHHHFGRPSPPGVKRPGRAAVDHVVINAVLPYRLAMAQQAGRAQVREDVIRLLKALPAEDNAVVRGWARAGLPVTCAAGSQALLELRAERCRQRRCLSCVIGLDLLRGPAR